MNETRTDAAAITLRPAAPGDAAAIAAVFDAAVRAGWTYLGDLAAEPMFTPQDWDQLVADHLPPRALLVAVGEPDGIVGYTAVHPEASGWAACYTHPSAVPHSAQAAGDGEQFGSGVGGLEQDGLIPLRPDKAAVG